MSSIATVFERRPGRLTRFPTELWLAFSVVLATNLPYWSAAILPVHDSLYTYEGFHVAYRELYYYGHLPHWAPFAAYGMPAGLFQTMLFTPSCYLVGLIGLAVRSQDTWLLFKLATILDQLVFITGLYLLGRRLYVHRSATVLVCVAAAGSLLWHTQVHFNFRIYYLLPLLIHELVRFVDTRQTTRLWTAALVGVITLIGNVAYFAPIWLIVGTIVLTILAGLERSVWRSAVGWSKGAAAAAAACVVVAGIYAVATAQSVQGLSILSPGRDQVDGSVELATFLTYGGQPDLAAGVRGFVAGWPTFLPWGGLRDNSTYVGLLPLVAAGWAFLALRGRRFAAIATAWVIVMWLTAGGALAMIAYYVVPTMNRYRHLSLLWGLAKIMLLICAGFGWDHFWSGRAGRWRLILVALGALVAVDLVRIVSPIDVVESLRAWRSNLQMALAGDGDATAVRVWPALVAARLLAYAAVTLAAIGFAWIARRAWLADGHTEGWARTEKALRVGLLIGLVIDLGMYQARAWAEAVRLAEPLVAHRAGLELEPRHAAVQRNGVAGTPRQAAALAMVQPQQGVATYAYAYEFADVDGCVSETPAFRVDWWVEPVHRLLEHAGDPVQRAQRLGCTENKVVLVSGEPAGNDRATSLPLSQDHVSVQQFTANRVVIDAEVHDAAGARLIYRDAIHPNWRARVNGEPVPIEAADGAWKAVKLPQGRSTVEFEVSHGLFDVLGIVGLLAGAGLVTVCVIALARPRPEIHG